MLTYHGTTKKALNILTPQYYAGSNGSQDGIGVNVTNSLQIAQDYATPEGRLLLLYLNHDNFLRIDDQTRLSDAQCARLDQVFDLLPLPLQLRLATDINGKQTTRFRYEDENKAKTLYQQSKQRFADVPELPDRIRPSYDFEKSHIDIHLPRARWDLSKTDTAHLHYVLNLVDNALATELFKKISDGLILPKENGAIHFLSFRANETVLADFSVKQSQQATFLPLLEALSSLSPGEWLEHVPPGRSPEDNAAHLMDSLLPQPNHTTSPQKNIDDSFQLQQKNTTPVRNAM